MIFTGLFKILHYLTSVSVKYFIVDHNIDNLIPEAAAGAPSLYTTIIGFVC